MRSGTILRAPAAAAALRQRGSHIWARVPRRLRDVVALVMDQGPAGRILWGVVLATFATLVVEAYYLNHPQVEIFPDTASYLGVARDILARGQLVHTNRLPGYPLVIAFCSLLTGGINLGALSVVNEAFFVLATIESYLLALLVFRRTRVAFPIGLLIGVDVSEFSFIKPILSEGLALFACTSLALAVVLFVRGMRARTLWVVTALTLALFMTRPEWIYLPVLLFGYLMFIAARRGRLRYLLPHAGAGVILFYGVLGAYVYVNATQNDFAGVSEIQRVNLFGKVMQYHMQNEAPPGYASVAATVDAYVSRGVQDPFVILSAEPGYQQHHYELIGDYSTAVIESHPLQFAWDTAPLMFTSLVTYDDALSVVDPHGSSAWLLLRLQSFFLRVVRPWYGTFTLLAAFCLALALWNRGVPAAYRRPLEMIGVIALLGLYDVAIGSAGAYGEYARLHAPLEPLIVLIGWGCPLAAIFIGARYLWRRYQRSVSGAQPVSANL